MNSEFCARPLSEVASIGSGKRPLVVSKEKTTEFPVPIIGGGGVSGFTSSSLFSDDLLITGRVGTLGKLHVSNGACWPSDNALVVRPREEVIDFGYLRYALSAVIDQAIGMNRGAANPLVTQGDLGKLPIVTPARPLQIEIGATLKQLDDRITLLLETNATLEAIAQALFKSWFVDFDPVRAKMAGHAPEGMDEATAALFPDALEEMELGLVPRGWQQCCVDDVASLKGGKQLEKEHFKIEGRYPVFGGAGVMGRSDSFNAEGFVITVGRVGAYCGQYFWTQGKAWVNNNASLVSAKTAAHSVWLLHWLKSVDMDVIKKGAAQPFVSNGDIASLKMVLPPNDLIGQFVEVCASIYIRLSGLSSQAQTLTDLRDSALCRFVWKAPVPAASE